MTTPPKHTKDETEVTHETQVISSDATRSQDGLTTPMCNSP